MLYCLSNLFCNVINSEKLFYIALSKTFFMYIHQTETYMYVQKLAQCHVPSSVTSRSWKETAIGMDTVLSRVFMLNYSIKSVIKP
jgi:hypothetical protein